MGKQHKSTKSRKREYSEQQLAGIHAHSISQHRVTVDRLKTSIAILDKEKRPISISTIREVSGLEYNTIKRNPEAYSLYRQYSTYLKAQYQQSGSPELVTPSPHDQHQAYEKQQHLTQLHTEKEQQEKLEAQQVTQYTKLLEETVQKDLMIAQLQAKLADYEGYLGQLRFPLQKKEQQDQ